MQRAPRVGTTQENCYKLKRMGTLRSNQRRKAYYLQWNEGKTDLPRLWKPEDNEMSSLENQKKVMAKMEFSPREISFKTEG